MPLHKVNHSVEPIHAPIRATLSYPSPGMEVRPQGPRPSHDSQSNLSPRIDGWPQASPRPTHASVTARPSDLSPKIDARPQGISRPVTPSPRELFLVKHFAKPEDLRSM